MPLYGNISLPGCPDLANIRKLDTLPLPMIGRMSRAGIAIDIPYLHDLTARLQREMETLRIDIACEIPPDRLGEFMGKADDIDDWCPINVESGPQIATLLFDMLEIGRGKQLKTTKGGDRLSTGKKQLEILKKDHPVIGLLLQYRERSKLVNTYTDKLPRIAKFHPRSKCCPVCELSHPADSWRIHTELVTTRTDTGRLASRSPNLQNIPAKTELGRLVRAAFIPTPGHVLISCDYAQIELRLLAHCAADAIMQDIFRRNGDIHVETAMHAFGFSSPDQVDKLLHRAPCKNLNFGICLQGGQLVLTNHGLIPIEKLTSQMLLWDGCSWVRHNGVVYKGIKKVISHEAITGTPDHNIWSLDGSKLSISQALAERRSLAITAVGNFAIRYPGDYFANYTSGQVSESEDALLGLPNPGSLLRGQSSARLNSHLYVPSREEVPGSTPGIEVIDAEVLLNSAKVWESAKRMVAGLWRARDTKPFSVIHAFHLLCTLYTAASHIQKSGYWQDRQQRPLRTGEHSSGDESCKSPQHPKNSVDGVSRSGFGYSAVIRGIKTGLSKIFDFTKKVAEAYIHRHSVAGDRTSTGAETEVEVYDVLYAGPRHRFTCNGRLVSNCYGLTESGLFDQMALTYATAGKPMPEYITVEWCKDFIQSWFSVYRGVEPYMDLQYYRARRYEMIWDQLGRIRRVPEVRSCHSWIQSAGLRQSGNMPIQALAAGVMKIGMARTEDNILTPLWNERVWCWPLLPIHDELIIESEEDYAEYILERIVEEFSLSMTDTKTGRNLCSVPIGADGKVMDRWLKN